MSNIRNKQTFNTVELLKVSKPFFSPPPTPTPKGRAEYAPTQAIAGLPQILQTKSQHFRLKQSSWLLRQRAFLSEHVSALFTMVQTCLGNVIYVCTRSPDNSLEPCYAGWFSQSLECPLLWKG